MCFSTSGFIGGRRRDHGILADFLDRAFDSNGPYFGIKPNGVSEEL